MFRETFSKLVVAELPVQVGQEELVHVEVDPLQHLLEIVLALPEVGRAKLDESEHPTMSTVAMSGVPLVPSSCFIVSFCTISAVKTSMGCLH